MNAKTSPLLSHRSYRRVLIFVFSFIATVSTFESRAAEANTARSGNIVSESFRRHGEYIDPNGDGYPTSVKVEYVMGCLTANGMSLENLNKCACSIDYIAAELPYEEYTKADTVLRAQLDTGTKGAVFRESNWAKDMVGEMQELQSASTLECF